MKSPKEDYEKKKWWRTPFVEKSVTIEKTLTGLNDLAFKYTELYLESPKPVLYWTVLRIPPTQFFTELYLESPATQFFTELYLEYPCNPVLYWTVLKIPPTQFFTELYLESPCNPVLYWTLLRIPCNPVLYWTVLRIPLQPSSLLNCT